MCVSAEEDNLVNFWWLVHMRPAPGVREESLLTLHPA